MSQICSVNKKSDRRNINEIKMLVLLFCYGRRYILLLDKKSFSFLLQIAFIASCAETKRGSGFIGAEAFFVPSFLMISGYSSRIIRRMKLYIQAGSN